MNDGKTIFALILGAAVGSLITWKVVTDKYERIIDNIYAEQGEETEAGPVDADTENRKMTREEYEAKVAQSGYAGAFQQPVQAETKRDYKPVEDEATDEEQEGDVYMEDLGPRVVSPEEFDDCDYPVVEFTHYADGFLTDEDDEIVSDIANTVGKDYDKHFGEYDEDPDVVYVICDEDQVRYEICRDNRKYMNVRAARIDGAMEE